MKNPPSFPFLQRKSLRGNGLPRDEGALARILLAVGLDLGTERRRERRNINTRASIRKGAKRSRRRSIIYHVWIQREVSRT